jgi:hypothetical protein
MKKIRVIVNDVSFYSSSNAIQKGVGDSERINKIVQRAYANLLQSNDGSVGIALTDTDGHKVQIDFV